jgi:hypothetical protein
MNTVVTELTQGTVFLIVVHTDAVLAGALATMKVTEGNSLDSTISGMMSEPGPELASLTSTPEAGLVIDEGAGTITATVSSIVTAAWPAGWASFQMFVAPTTATRQLVAQALIDIAKDITVQT